jgi:hypothetical protein
MALGNVLDGHAGGARQRSGAVTHPIRSGSANRG